MRVVVGEDDVQVRGITEFLAAKLAVTDDGETRVFAVPPPKLGPAKLEHDLQHHVGEELLAVLSETDNHPPFDAAGGLLLRRKPFDMPPVNVAEPFRNQDLERGADRFLPGVAEHPFGAGVEYRYALLFVDGDQRISRDR